MSSVLPSYGNPPVVETILGVQFSPIEKWGIPHFGLFWQTIVKNYPSFQGQMPILAPIEQPTIFAPSPEAQVEVVLDPPARCQFVSENLSDLVQVQRDCFYYNWRKIPGGVYPRYAQFVRPGFERNWAKFCDFLAAKNLGKPTVIQCEVSYVNHIPRGVGWETVSEWHNVLKSLSPSDHQTLLRNPESIKLDATYSLAPSGRLRVTSQHAVRQIDSKEIIALTLTARGKPASSDVQDITAWFDVGHHWVVQGFTDLTTERMHELWERQV
jgi:uncharacterized protein (TIGR04255 family)